MELFRRELLGNMYSWRGGLWLVSASSIFSAVAYLLLTDKELSLLDQGEGLFLLGQVILSVGLILSAASASAAISGEVEAGTFECLLLTPIHSASILLQKLLSVVALWAMLYAVSIPYLIVLASGTNLAPAAILYVGLYGTVCVIALSSISITLSARLNSSKNSIPASLMIALMLLAPSLFFATALKMTDFGLALENINPVSHAINSLDSVLVDNEQALFQQSPHLLVTFLFLMLSFLLLLWYARRLEVRASE